MALSQLMCYSESTFVKIIQVVTGVKKLLFKTIFFFIISCSLKHCSDTASALDYGGKHRNVPDKQSLSLWTEFHLPYGHKLWPVTIRKRSWVAEAEIRFLCREARLFPHDRERSSVIRKYLGVKPPISLSCKEPPNVAGSPGKKNLSGRPPLVRVVTGTETWLTGETEFHRSTKLLRIEAPLTWD